MALNAMKNIRQCGNFIIFLSLRLYVISKLMNLDFRISKSAILTHLVALNCDFYEFLHFVRLKFTKSTKFRAPKMTKTAVLELRGSPKLISRKILKHPHCARLGQMGTISVLQPFAFDNF